MWGGCEKSCAKMMLKEIPPNMTESCITDYEAWLRRLAEKGGKGTVDNIDARSLGRVADLLRRYTSIIRELRAEHAWTRETIAQSAAETWANYKHETPDLWLTVADAIIFALEHANEPAQ